MQVVGGEVFAGDDGEDAGDGEGGAGVNVGDASVGVGAADDVHVEHSGQLDVVYVVAFAAQEAGVFFALHAVAHAADFGRGGDAEFGAGLDGGRAVGGDDVDFVFDAVGEVFVLVGVVVAHGLSSFLDG